LKERQAANDYDSKWGFMKEKRCTNNIQPKLTVRIIIIDLEIDK